MGDVKRSVRVSARLREELAELLAHEVRDPRLEGAVVTSVEMPDDLRSAKVGVRVLQGGEDPARRKELLTGLERASGLLRREVTQRLSLRFAPELRFVYDEGLDKQARIEELLHEVHVEDQARKRGR